MHEYEPKRLTGARSGTVPAQNGTSVVRLKSPRCAAAGFLLGLMHGPTEMAATVRTDCEPWKVRDLRFCCYWRAAFCSRTACLTSMRYRVKRPAQEATLRVRAEPRLPAALSVVQRALAAADDALIPTQEPPRVSDPRAGRAIWVEAPVWAAQQESAAAPVSAALPVAAAGWAAME